MQNPILSILVLISNRPDTVSKCLDSLQPLLERIPSELILTDTGCGEKVRNIIEKYDAKILDFEWCKDFAKARNVGLKEAKGEWILYVDDDEWFEDTTEIEHFFNSGDYKNYGCATYIQRNYQDYNGYKYYDFNVYRIYKNLKDMKFIYPIHERLDRIYGPRKFLGDFVHHYGYVFDNEDEREKHAKRNLELLEEENRKKPLDIHIALHYVAPLAVHNPDKAIEVCEQIIDGYRGGSEEEDSYVFLPTLIEMYLVADDKAKAKECADWALKSQINSLQRAHIYANMARLYNSEGKYEDAYRSANEYYLLYKIKDVDDYRKYVNPLNATVYGKKIFATVMQEGMCAALEIGKYDDARIWFEELDSEEFGVKANFVSEKLIEKAVLSYIDDDAKKTEIAAYILEKLLSNEKAGKKIADLMFRECDNYEKLAKFSKFKENNNALLLSKLAAKMKELDVEINYDADDFKKTWESVGEIYIQAKKLQMFEYILGNLDGIKQYISRLTYAEWDEGVFTLISVCDKEHIEKIAEALLSLASDNEERILTVSYAYDRRILQDKNEYKKLMQFERMDRIYSFAYDVENRCKLKYSQHILNNFENYLNAEEIFGLKFIQILQCVQNGEFESALAITKTMVTSESVFLEYVKDIVKFINEEAIESRFDPQMKELAMQIRGKIRELKQNGDEEAAIETEKMLRKFYE